MFYKMNIDILINIISYCDTDCILNLRLIEPQLNYYIQNNYNIWNTLFKKNFKIDLYKYKLSYTDNNQILYSQQYVQFVKNTNMRTNFKSNKIKIFEDKYGQLGLALKYDLMNRSTNFLVNKLDKYEKEIKHGTTIYTINKYNYVLKNKITNKIIYVVSAPYFCLYVLFKEIC